MNLRQILLLPCLLLLAPAINGAQTKLDSIVAIVDESVITNRELNDRIDLVKADFSRTKRRLPSETVLQRQVLEALITDAVLLQEAERRGIKVTDGQLNQTMQRLARQNDLTLSEFRQRVIAEGLDYNRYRNTVRQEMIMSTLSRQYGQSNVTISEAEVDDFIKLSGAGNDNYEYELSHILIALPDAATPEQISEAMEKATTIMDKLEAGEQFEELANAFSADDNALQGGDLGWRKQAEIPSLFTSVVIEMEPGDNAGPIRSASGFHIVHLNARRVLATTIIEQTRSSHILIKTNELISEQDAQARLLEFRERIEAGEDFARLARLYSVDYANGVNGGDLGWMNPGSTVREYEEVLEQLEINEISQPVRTQYGWHLIKLTGRRTVDETEQNLRDRIYSQLLQQKERELFDLWKRRLRDEAYVVYPDQPDA